MNTTEKFYKKAVHRLDEGATINELYELLFIVFIRLTHYCLRKGGGHVNFGKGKRHDPSVYLNELPKALFLSRKYFF